MTNPKFITFEGGDGSGKTTQSKKLYEYLIKKGIDTIWTREIGGTEIGEKIRDIVVNNEIHLNTELLLIMAARNDHIENIIKPALEKKKIVICDRFIDSTAAYQGSNQDEIKKIFYLHQTIWGNFYPDRTIYMKLDPEIALNRAISRGEINKYEHKSLEFHNKIAENYEYLAKTFAYRINTLDASLNERKIFDNMINHLGL